MLAYHTESIGNKIIFVCKFVLFCPESEVIEGGLFPFEILICTIASIDHRKSYDRLLGNHLQVSNLEVKP
jgi:hypothetical protein